jgi:ectoine hydrolase
MTTPPPASIPFSAAEYDRRIAKTRAAMARAGIDVLFATDPSNQAWLTGYDGWSFYVHQGVILGPDGPPIWWGRGQDANGARRTVWMGEDHIHGYADTYVQSTTSHPMQDLAERLRALGHGGARIGVEMENYYYSAKAHAVLCAALPDARFVDATALVNWQRAVKSDEEIAFIRKAAKISDHIVRQAIELAAPGVRKNELVGDILRAACHGVDGIWGDYAAIVPLTPSGADASAPHLTWNGDAMREGEATFFELSGCYRRYHAPLCRTVHLGPPPDFMRRASDALTAGLEAGIAAAKPGNRTADVAQALNAELAKEGITRGERAGYPIGLSYPPDWGERTFSIRTNDDTVLEPGMTFHFMPGLWMDGWGLETTETLLIREDGAAEALGTVERKMFVKD